MDGAHPQAIRLPIATSTVGVTSGTRSVRRPGRTTNIANATMAKKFTTSSTAVWPGPAGAKAQRSCGQLFVQLLKHPAWSAHPLFGDPQQPGHLLAHHGAVDRK